MSNEIKKKLDLNNLLAKYESGNRVGYSATHQQNFYDSRKVHQNQPIEQEFYNTNSYFENNRNVNSRVMSARKHQAPNESFKGNFQMSKQECEAFLLKVLAELDSEKKDLNMHGERVLLQISERFSRNHEIIRREILELLDRSFRQNQKHIKQELFKHSKEQPVEFDKVYRQIKQLNIQVDTYMRMLGGNEYRKAISEVVLKDYTFEIGRLRETIKEAKLQYLESLGEVQPDRTRIECIKQDLRCLFYFKKKTAQVIEKSIFSVIGGAGTNTLNVPQKNFSSPQRKQKVSSSAAYEHQKPPNQDASRTRKSFFNFGGN